jgi:hypothetical protein
MTIITGITDQPNQQTTILLPDGTRVKVTLAYRVQQSGWFYDLVWTKADGSTFTLNGQRVVTSPNLLHQFRNLISFGLAVVNDKNQEPVTLKAFASGVSKVVLLSAAEVAQITAAVFPGL